MAGVFKFLSPRAPPQPIDIQAAALWGVAAVTTALWIVQVPLFFWLKLIYFTFYYFDDWELKTVVARRRDSGATATSTCFASLSDHFVFSAFSHYYCFTFNFCDYIFLQFFSKCYFLPFSKKKRKKEKKVLFPYL